MERGLRSYKKLDVWIHADQMAFRVYEVTRSFPADERFGITSQLRRAALSVPTNIVEGSSRQNKGERKQFMNIALASLAETEYLMSFACRLRYISEGGFQDFLQQRDRVGALLWGFYRSI